MSRVAIVTDSASDLTPDMAGPAGISVVPLIVNFGAESFRSGVDLSTDEFWRRMTAPDAPFPTTAAASPGDFHTVFERCFAEGADSIVCVDVADTLSGTIKSARIAREMMAERDIHIVDSQSASMGVGILALMASEMAGLGVSGAEIARILTDRVADSDLYLGLDTLEYLRKGGRLSGAQATIGTLLSLKPIITVTDGLVATADRVRTRSKARERVIGLLTARPLERLAILYTPPADVEAFRADVLARATGLDPSRVTVGIVGPSVGPHLGPGCLGGVVLYARS